MQQMVDGSLREHVGDAGSGVTGQHPERAMHAASTRNQKSMQRPFFSQSP